MKRVTIVRTIITKGNELLILKRRKNAPLVNREWTSPCFLSKECIGEDGNSKDIVQETVLKIKEKTGLTIKKPVLLSFESHVDKEENKLIITFIFLSEYAGKSQCMDLNLEAFTSFQWIKLDQKESYSTVPWLTKCLDDMKNKKEKERKIRSLINKS